jgi:Na+-driven multidrug efflux pump
MLQYEFQSFFSTAEKPQMGLNITILAGVTNIVLDALFIAVLNGGLVAAAAATVCGQLVGGIIPVFYFARKNPSPLRLTRTAFDKSALWKACTNGSSELMSNISMSVVSMLYNAQLMKYAGENGVAAYGVLMYVNLIFLAAFIGYSVGAAPIISYHFGAGHRSELSSLLKKSLRIIFFFSVSMLALSQILAKPLSHIFVGYDPSLLTLTLRGFQIFSFSFLFAGAAIFGSAFFTTLNNGLVSALISFLRTLLFQVAAVLIFPLIWQIDGIWMSVAAAEFLAAAVTALFILAMRKKYQY